jgi:ankyrin repeat protein
MKYEIKYRTKKNIACDEIYSLSHFELINNNYILDLSHLGNLTNIEFPNNLLSTKEPIKFLAKFNIWFNDIKDYKDFLDKTEKDLNIEKINTEENLNKNCFSGDGIEIKRINNLVSYSFNSYYPDFKFGKIEYFKYDPINFCATLSCIISEDVIGNQLLFLTQTELMDLCSQKIRTNNNKELLKLLEFTEDINLKNKDDNHLYFVAAWNNNINALKILKEKGAIFQDDINIAGARHASVLEYLKEINILYVNYKDENGFNPLQQACVLKNNFLYDQEDKESEFTIENITSERIKSISFLINEGADINIENNEGRNALMTAASQSNYELSDKLIELGINCEAISKEGKLFTDYSNNDYYNNYFLFCYKTYFNLFEIFKQIRKEYIKSKDSVVINNLYSNLYVILDLDLDLEEKNIDNNQKQSTNSSDKMNEYYKHQDKCIFLHIKPNEEFIEIVNNLYKEKFTLKSVNIDEYNKMIEAFENVLKIKIFFEKQVNPLLHKI